MRIMDENTQLKHMLSQRESVRGRADPSPVNPYRENALRLLREALRNTKAENKILKEHLSKTLSDSYNYKSRIEAYVLPIPHDCLLTCDYG